jgi:putative intracellular protease/amidase
MGKKVLIVASNYGLWAEELQGPWDALKKAGHKLTLATYKGLPPGILKLSMDPAFVDPMQKVAVNPAPMVERVKQILADGEWDHPIKIADANMADYDALVLVGGPGSTLDIVGNARIHQKLVEAYQSDKIIGAICYAVGALVWARNPDNDGKSIMWGKTVTAHPREWDFIDDLPYWLHNPTPENPELNFFTPGFVFPLAQIVENAVGPQGKVLSKPNTTHENPLVAYDYPFVTALSAESSAAFGDKLVEVLATQPSAGRKFFRRHIQYFLDKDVDGLVSHDYTKDAVVQSVDFVVQGPEALRALFTGYLQMIGDFTLNSVDGFIETDNIIQLEATMQTTNAGLRKVYDIFVMKDGKIQRHITGVK